MKKILSLFLCMTFLLSLLASCNGTSEGELPTVAATEPQEPVPTMLDIVKDGKTDYVVVVNFKNNAEKDCATALFDVVRQEVGVTLKIMDSNTAQSSYPYEIAIGSARDYSAKLQAELEGEDFRFCTSGRNLVFCATSDTMYDYLSATFSKVALARARKGTWMVSSKQDMRYTQSEFAHISYVQYYRAVNGTFGSWYEEHYASISKTVRDDVELCNALKLRLQDGAVVMNGKSTALYNQNIVQLDNANYQACAQVGSDGKVLVPKAFVQTFFGASASADANGLVNLTDYVKNNSSYSLEVNGELAILLPTDSEGFADSAKTVEGYTNAVYLNRMKQFFAEFIVPDTDAEQSRVVVEDTTPYYSVQESLDYKTVLRKCCYSPSFLSVEENGNQVMYASYEFRNLRGFYENGGCTSYIKKSTDGGLTWSTVATLPNFIYGELFTLNGSVYLIGHINQVTHVIKINPDGTKSSGNLGKYIGVNPTNSLLHNGRLYFVTDEFVASVAETADPMVSSNWEFSNSISEILTNEWLKKETGLPADTMKWSYMEGNVNLSPDGEIYLTFRLNTNTSFNEHIVVVKLEKDGKTVKVVKIADCPTTLNKFTIHYDAQTGYYLMLTSEYRANPLITSNERSNVVLLASKDLLTWEKAANIISDRVMMNSAYQSCIDGWQYIDWQIVGEDICMLVREADEKGTSYHDGTYATFYRISNFRELFSK